MPVYPSSLMKLVAYLNDAASVQFPADVATISQHTNISTSNIRLLLNKHNDIFHSVKINNVLCYYLVTSADKAQRILASALRSQGVPMNTPGIAAPVNTALANEQMNTEPVAATKQWLLLTDEDMRTADSTLTDKQSLDEYWGRLRTQDDIYTREFIRATESILYILGKLLK